MTIALNSIPDRQLISLSLQGNAEAYGCLYDRYIDQIYRFIFFRINNKEDAEDLTEMVFLKTYDLVKQNKTKIHDLKPWLFQVARNLVIDYYRTRKDEENIENIVNASDSQPLPEEAVISRENQALVRKMLAMLEPHLQEILICRFMDKLSYAETAQITGVSEKYLRVLQYRALKKLSSLLEENEDGK